MLTKVDTDADQRWPKSVGKPHMFRLWASSISMLSIRTEQRLQRQRSPLPRWLGPWQLSGEYERQNTTKHANNAKKKTALKSQSSYITRTSVVSDWVVIQNESDLHIDFGSQNSKDVSWEPWISWIMKPRNQQPQNSPAVKHQAQAGLQRHPDKTSVSCSRCRLLLALLVLLVFYW